MHLEEAVPWGRLASEYISMFSLTPQDMAGRLLDCGGGPSSFTAELTRQSKQVVSCDPLYQFTVEEIGQRIDATYIKMTALNEANRDNFLWDMYGTPAKLGQIRMRAMRLFLDDYVAGKEQARYITGGVPRLPFAPDSFDLALCSHFLFTYSEQFTEEFHVQSVVEMVRVAREVRLFPLLTAFDGQLSPHLPIVMESLRKQGCSVEVCPVAYEFQKGGNRMLRVCRASA